MLRNQLPLTLPESGPWLALYHNHHHHHLHRPHHPHPKEDHHNYHNNQVKQLENVLLGYLSALAFYKFFYILNWVHRYYNEVIFLSFIETKLSFPFE